MNHNNEEKGHITMSAIKSMMENMTDMFFVKDRNLCYTGGSQSFARFVGAKESSDLIGKTDAQLFSDEELVRRYTNDDLLILETCKPLKSYIEPLKDEHGIQYYCKTSKFPLFNQQGAVIGLYGMTRDITKDYKAQLNYEQELRALFDLPPTAIGAALLDLTNWRIVDIRINHAAWAQEFIHADTIDKYIEATLSTIADGEDACIFYRSCTKEFFQAMFESGQRQLNIEYQRKFPDTSLRWVHNDLFLLSDPVTGNLCVMSIVEDIDQEKQAAYALIRVAQRDALTNVYNRETTMSMIQNFLSREGHANTHFLFMIDIDNFKAVNDTLGHQTGDDLLIYVADSICNIFYLSDIVGRIGGDEFFVLMKNVNSLHVVHKRAMELVEALQYECSDGSNRICISGSIGISRYCGDEKSLEQLYAEADSALYKAKQKGKNCYFFADASIEVCKKKESLNTVNLRVLLENIDASMFQTEFTEEGDISVNYSSHTLFSGDTQTQQQWRARGENLWDIILPEDLPPFKTAILDSTKRGTALDHSCRIRNSDGQVAWRHVCGTHLPDQKDGISRMIHVVTDITQQKQAEAELLEKNSIIDFAMRNTDVNLWYFDYDTAQCHLTKSCQIIHEMPGIESLENFPDCLFQIGYVREDCIEPLRAAYEKLRKTGENLELDVWFRKADGTGWWCERDMLSPLVGADGLVTRGIGIGKNVTAEKLLQEKYETFGTYQRLSEKNTRTAIHLNLTTGRIIDCVTNVPGETELCAITNVEELFTLLRSRIIFDDDNMKPSDNLFSRDKLLSLFAQGKTSHALKFQFRNECHYMIWIRFTFEIMRNPVSSHVEALLYSFDIDHEKNMQLMVDKLVDCDYEFLGIIDTITGRLMVFNQNGNNPSAAKNDALYEEEAKRIFKKLILDEYYDEGIRNMTLDHILEELSTKEYYTCSFPAKDCAYTSAGRKQWKFAYLDKTKSKIFMTRTDITSLYTAEYDALTGLYNRETFYRRARQIVNDNPSTDFIILRFDIDKFKAYNELYGTQAGDRLLASAGRAFRARKWPSPCVFGRLEADHFVSILPEAKFNISTWSVQQAQWLKSATEGFRLTSSIGIYRIVDPSIDVALMCDRCLLALRTVKDNYTQKIAWYNDALWQQILYEQTMTDTMEQALMQEEFVIFLQPLIDYKNETLVGAEALVRWNHPTQGLIPPGKFIPLFEKNGFILKLDTYVWEKSCQYLRKWIDMGKAPVPISVNVSRRNLYDPELCATFETLLGKYRLPFSLLKLEITESAYMDAPDQLMSIVEELRSAGFTVEMDDFGTGYSSLNMLREMPVDVLKLDTHFISESKRDKRAATILSSIIHMAHQLGLSVIAEGVETREQADSLKELKCFYMQGFYFNKPLPVEEFEKLL